MNLIYLHSKINNFLQRVLRRKVLLKKFSLFLRILISFQLVFIPHHSFSASKSKDVFDQEEILNDPNKELIFNYLEKVKSLQDIIFSDIHTKNYQEHPLDSFSLLGQRVEKYESENQGVVPYFKYVNPKNINIEIINKQGEVLGSLNQKGNSVYKSNNQKGELHFRISYQNIVLHNFDHNIKWIALLDGSIVFLQAGKTSKSQSSLSFINLKYFGQALGKTTLPIFKLPIDLSTHKINPNEIENPLDLTIEDSGLKITSSVKLSKEDMLGFSNFQQMIFDIMVSLVDPTTYQDVQPILKEIVKTYENAFEKNNEKLIKSFDKNKHKSYQRLKRYFSQSLISQSETGSAGDITGVYGNLKEAEHFLEKESERKPIKEFSESLKVDEAFQTALLQVSEGRMANEKLFNRVMILVHKIIHPQPLGAPKIRTALAMIAGATNPYIHHPLEVRKSLFKSGVKDFLNNKKTKIGVPLLVGLGIAVAHPEASLVLDRTISSLNIWLSHLGEIAEKTSTAATAFLNFSDLKDIYISDGKYPKFLTGLGAMFGIFFGAVGVIHLVTNSYFYLKDFRASKISNLKEHLINYMNQGKKQFVMDLASAELRKMGLSMDFTLPDGKVYKGLFRSNESLKNLLSSFKHDQRIKFTISSADGKKNHVILKTHLNPSEEQKEVNVTINDSKNKLERALYLERGFLEDYFHADSKTKKEEGVIEEVSLKIKGDSFGAEGLFLESTFSEEEDLYVKKLLKEVRKERKSKQKNLSQEEIDTLGKAIKHLFLGYSTWVKTFFVLGKTWNRFFFARSFMFRPVTLSTMIFNSKYYDRVYKDNHKPTHLNGGLGFSAKWISKSANTLTLRKEKQATLKQQLNKVKEFESRVIPIEKAYFKVATEQAIIFLLKEAVKKPRLTTALREGVSSNPSVLHKAKNKKQMILFRAYQDLLFYKAMQEYLEESSGYKDKSPKELKKLITSGEELNLPEESIEQIRKRVLRIVREEDIEAKALKSISGLKNIFKKMSIARHAKIEKVLDPKETLAMERYDVSEKGLHDSEAMARASRQQLIKMAVDKPIESMLLFLGLAGVEQGILKVLHEDMFSEESFFYFSRYAIWNGFFAALVLGALSDVWSKIQMDSRVDDLGGFDGVPDKKDVDKKFSATRWYWKQMLNEDNTFIKNYRFSNRIIIANIPAAFFTITILDFLTLGRFDLEAYIVGYMIVFMTGYVGLQYKFETAFEKAANYALRPLIQKGLTFKDRNQKYLAHPEIQSFKIKELIKLRAKYNLKIMFLYENPLGVLVDMLGNIDTSIGSRAFGRLFFGGHLITEWLMGGMDTLERHSLIPSSWAESCKKIFVKNRPDI